MSARNLVPVCAVVVTMMFVSVSAAWSQEAPVPASEQTRSNSEPQWLWGEIEAVNAQAKTVQVKYLDYDTDIEKELVITVDDKTKFENAKGLEEIKAQDTVSVDYLSGSDGKNLALAVSVEKLEDMETVPADALEPAAEIAGSAQAESAVIPPVVQAAEQKSAPAVPADAGQPAPVDVKQ
jgi:hypothetical protein